jgi:tetratricopeptide (TPR) repeat protein
MSMVKLQFLPAVIVILSFSVLRPAWTDEIEDLLSDVDEAVADESYTRAISLLEEGKVSYPEDPRLPAKAGRLYMERELYRLAIAEFLAAEELGPDNPELQYDMAATYGYLGDNMAAAHILENLLSSLESGSMRPRDSRLRDDVVDDLSWMYFKIYRLDAGIELLEKALAERFDRNWAQTLGTLYSGKYEREKSRYWYERSIEDAMEAGDEYFASVARYNLSLLEFSFYRYDDARTEAEISVELRNRAGGHLVLGELDFLEWNLENALDSYRVAESLDQTPLSRMDIAAFYQRIGRPDEAIRLVEDIINESDESWMYHYGLDRTRFESSLHSVLRDSFRGKAEINALTPKYGVFQRFASMVRRTEWRLRAMYHDRKFRGLTARVARELYTEGNELDAAWNDAMANRGYRRNSVKHFQKARKLETAIMPQAEPWYLLEIGAERKDPRMIMDALNSFSPEEGDPRERGLRLLSGSIGRRAERDTRMTFIGELYRMNPGGLRSHGLSLPIVLSITGEEGGRMKRQLTRLLRRSGYSVKRRSAEVSVSSVVTVARDGRGNLKWFMADPQGTTKASLETRGDISPRRTAEALGGLLNLFYTTPVEGTVR